MHEETCQLLVCFTDPETSFEEYWWIPDSYLALEMQTKKKKKKNQTSEANTIWLKLTRSGRLVTQAVGN
jgi:hypothetical protein